MALAPFSGSFGGGMFSSQAAERRNEFGGLRQSRTLHPGAMLRRRLLVGFAKRVLPMLAVLLLAAVVLWPEIARWTAHVQLRGLKLAAAVATGVLTDVHYSGVDERGRPYTVTASQARQVSPQRVDLASPKGDVLLEGGRWLMAQSERGVYTQHVGNLDMSGNVTLYRDDGATLQTDTTTLDLKNGAASSAAKVHAEGPFGTLDAQGFSLTDRGTQIQFWGPGRLVMNAAHH